MNEAPSSIRIYVDADACPVKNEIYRVADRYALTVFVVSNSFIRVPKDPRVTLIAVDSGPDAADDWIAERAGSTDIVITGDTPLASRCLKAGATVLGPSGKPFTTDSIGAALAGRNIAEHLRSFGEGTNGQPAFAPQDRSRFLSALDTSINRLRRK